ncbi:hypothetical protein [Vibrio sp. 10N.261.52.F3]|uniref:hypothetical protein n=1 Tax=Vibrio sp. 10N.261.52.F3 TaxID=3229683 RepID=UPI0035506360
MNKEIVKQVDAQLLFDAGALTKAIVVKAPLETKGCNLILVGSKKQQYVFASARKHKEPRIFRSYDGAIQMAERLGFKKVEVTL